MTDRDPARQTPPPASPLAAGTGAGRPPPVAPAPASAAKAAVLAEVDRAFESQVELLAALVRCPSVRGATNGVQAVVAGALRRTGLDVQEVGIDGEAIAALPGYSPAEWDYDGLIQVVGTLPGAAPGGAAAGGGRSLVLNGHVDVVPAETAAYWRHDPWGAEIEDGRLYGRGACDMKAGVAAVLGAVGAIRRAGIVLRGDVRVQSVLDEECGGNGTLALLAQGFRGDAAVIPEPTGLALPAACVGVLWGRIRVRGRAAHAGSASSAVNAIEKSYAVVRALREMEAAANLPERRHARYAGVEHPLNVNIGTIRGGDWPSSVPESCTLEVRVACYPQEDLAALEDRVRASVARAAAADPWLKDVPPEVSFFGFRGEGAVYDPESDIARAVAGNHRLVAGESPAVGVSTATDDRRLFQLHYGIPAVCYGPAGGGLHGVDEWVDLESMRTCTRVLAAAALDWCGVA